MQILYLNVYVDQQGEYVTTDEVIAHTPEDNEQNIKEAEEYFGLTHVRTTVVILE